MSLLVHSIDDVLPQSGVENELMAEEHRGGTGSQLRFVSGGADLLRWGRWGRSPGARWSVAPKDSSSHSLRNQGGEDGRVGCGVFNGQIEEVNSMKSSLRRSDGVYVTERQDVDGGIVTHVHSSNLEQHIRLPHYLAYKIRV